MSLPRSWVFGFILAGLSTAGAAPSLAQAPAQPDPAGAPPQSAPSAAQSGAPAVHEPTINVPAPGSAPAAAQPQPAAPTPSAESAAPQLPSSATPADANPPPARKTYTVPAGTKVLLELRSAVDTHSAKPGDGVYLSSTFPVVVGNRVMIPAGVYVQGVVDRVQRAGQVKGRAQLDMHFTSIIFPNGSVVEIPGVVDSVPGAKDQSVKNEEGTIEQKPDKGRDAARVAEIGIPVGGTVGTIGGVATGHPLAGGLGGLAAGAAAAGIVSLFTRGADVTLASGTQVEMVLQRPLLLEDANLAGVTPPGTAPTLVPSANQPRPLEKPRPRILCPPGGLGCAP
jgi:type IV secretion system protein VirB10